MKMSDKIKELRTTLGLRQHELAARIGEKDASLISKWESGRNKPRAERIAKLAELAGQTPGEFMGLRPMRKANVAARSIRVVGELRAGAWREAVEWDYDDQYEIAAPLVPGMPDVPLRGYVVRGTSMNNVYPDGTLVFVAATIANKIKPKSGQRVLVQRRNREGLYEATLKEFVVDPGGNKYLWPRSSDPEHQVPIPYTGEGNEDVTITGVVMAAFLMEALR